MGALSAAISRELPGTKVLSLDSSFGAGNDVLSGFFGDVASQVSRACRWLREHPAIRDSENGEFDAVGFSQGGLFLRALVQRCGNGGSGGGGGDGGDEASSSFSPRARTLITLGSPHQGVTAFPSCEPTVVAVAGEVGKRRGGEGEDADAADAPVDPDLKLNVSSPSFFCRAAEALIRRGAFAPGVRDRVVQAQYFKPDADPDPCDFPAVAEYERYLRLSPFLPKVNCEEEEEEEEEEKEGEKSLSVSSPRVSGKSCSSGSSSYSLSLASVNRRVLFRFSGDSVVVPRDSAWFSELRRGKVVPLRETPLYGSEGEDLLGLRALDESKRLFLKTAPGNHMRFSVEWFVREVVRPFLGDDDGKEEEGKGGGGGARAEEVVVVEGKDEA